MKRIGIFSGVFDPVHSGHIGFPLAAIQKANLDKVYLLVESKPRRKTGVTHVAHRVAMAKLATAHHPKLAVLVLPDRQFSVAKTLPRLRQRFSEEKLVLLIGSDMLEHMPDWPLVGNMLDQVELVIARRRGTSVQAVQQLIHALPAIPKKFQIIQSPAPETSSERIRESIKLSKSATNVPPSIRSYIIDNWLYVSPSASSSRSSS